jgi:cytidylate kinase
LKKKIKIKVGIDSPVAAGAGTISKLIAKNYKLLYLDTGKIYRFMARQIIDKKPKDKLKFLKKISRNINLNKLKQRNLLNDDVAYLASQIAKDLKVRNLVVRFQRRLAYHPPNKYNGSILDGRDINSKIIKDADFKFYITANIKERAKRRFKEYKSLNKKVKFSEIFKNLKKRDLEDRTRRHSKLKKTKDSILINTTNLSIRESFLKVKKIMDRKLKFIWA